MCCFFVLGIVFSVVPEYFIWHLSAENRIICFAKPPSAASVQWLSEEQSPSPSISHTKTMVCAQFMRPARIDQGCIVMSMGFIKQH